MMSKKIAGVFARTPPTGNPRGSEARLPYLPGLDGLRALAVIAVLLYHAEARWLPGGFIGVEVFFVLSGYLITSLLLAEWRQRGRVSLKGFWLRRGRRLLPAVFLLLAGTLAFAVVFLPEEVAGLRSDVAAAVGYVTNWYLILSHESYFEAVGRLSLLRHLWSLAVEEQFYLLWPLLFTALMRRWPLRRVLIAVTAGAVASTALMALLYRPDVDPSRVYYGTDTRAAGFLIGAALAFVWAPGRSQGRPRWWMLDAAGFGGLAGLVTLGLLLGEFDPWLYRGGFAVVALATALTIAATVHPQARLVPGLLGLAPLRWIGTRSYGIYLWHWPVFMATRPQLDVTLEGLPLLALRLAATGLLAELSYRFVEMPIRTGALGRAWSALREAHGAQRRLLGFRWAGSATAIVAFLVVLGGPVVSAQPPAPPAYLAVTAIDTLVVAEKPADALVPEIAEPAAPATPVPAADPVAPSTTAAEESVMAEAGLATTDVLALPETTVPEPTATPSPAIEPVPAERLNEATVDDTESLTTIRRYLPTTTATPPPTVTQAVVQVAEPAAFATPEPVRQVQPVRPSPNVPGALPTLVPNRVTAIGDSVMLGTVEVLSRTFGSLDISAALGRQPWTAAELLRTRREAGQLGAIVIIHLGNNGVFGAKNFDDIMGVLADAQRVVFVNVKVPRPWETATNTVLAEGVKRYPNAVLVDWRGATADRPELFWDDGMHIRPEGARLYVEMVVAAIKAPPTQVGPAPH
jgi:peptidoglycan/LPS O-acetylase OafA/YrhL